MHGIIFVDSNNENANCKFSLLLCSLTLYQFASLLLFICAPTSKDPRTISVNIIFSAYNFFVIALCLGTSVGGNDVVAFLDVGVVNHKAISGLTLHSGHSYYATVKGIYVKVSLKNIYVLIIPS